MDGYWEIRFYYINTITLRILIYYYSSLHISLFIHNCIQSIMTYMKIEHKHIIMVLIVLQLVVVTSLNAGILGVGRFWEILFKNCVLHGMGSRYWLTPAENDFIIVPFLSILFPSNTMLGYPISTDYSFSSVQLSHSVVSDSLQPHGLQHARLSCPSPTP